MVHVIPCASLLPGHFCLAVVNALVAGHVMFHTSSCPYGHPPSVCNNLISRCKMSTVYSGKVWWGKRDKFTLFKLLME